MKCKTQGTSHPQNSQVAELVDADDQIDVEFRISTHIQV